MEDKALHILEQVTRMYQRYGIKSVTMDDAARRMGISKKTLYEHFKDKEELVRYVVFKQFEHRDRFMNEIRQKKLNAIQELLEVYRLLHDIYKDYNPAITYDTRKYYPELYNEMREKSRKKMFESMVRNINKGKKEGLFRKDLNSQLISKLHIIRIENIFDSDLFTNEEISSQKSFHQIFVYHLNGLLSDKGRKYFNRNFKILQKSLDSEVKSETSAR